MHYPVDLIWINTILYTADVPEEASRKSEAIIETSLW